MLVDALSKYCSSFSNKLYANLFSVADTLTSLSFLAPLSLLESEALLVCLSIDVSWLGTPKGSHKEGMCKGRWTEVQEGEKENKRT